MLPMLYFQHVVIYYAWWLVATWTWPGFLWEFAESLHSTMEALKTKLSSLTVSNLTLIVVCALAIYLFRVRQTYRLAPQWRKEIEAEMYHNGKFPGSEEVVVPPVVTDLESDGTNEIVLLTTDLHLEVLVVPPQSATKKLPQPEIVHAVQLPVVRDDDGRPGRPVAIATGYLTEFRSVTQIRKQVNRHCKVSRWVANFHRCSRS